MTLISTYFKEPILLSIGGRKPVKVPDSFTLESSSRVNDQRYFTR
jgi:hypothetical protein